MFSVFFFIDRQEFDYGVDMFQLLSIILLFSAVRFLHANSIPGVVQHVRPLIPVYCPFVPIPDINSLSDPTVIMMILAFSQSMM